MRGLGRFLTYFHEMQYYYTNQGKAALDMTDESRHSRAANRARDEAAAAAAAAEKGNQMGDPYNGPSATLVQGLIALTTHTYIQCTWEVENRLEMRE